MPSRSPGTPVDSLRSALERVTVEGMKGLVRLFVDRPPGRKDELVDLVLARLQGEGLRKAWDRLTTLEKSVVAEAAHSAEPWLPIDRIRAKYGSVPGSTVDSSCLRRDAVVFDLFFYQGIMPEDLKEGLRAFVPPPPKASLVSLDALPSHLERRWTCAGAGGERQEVEVERFPLVVRLMERAAQLDLHAALRLVDAGRVQVGAKRKPSSASVAALRGLLSGGDFYPDDAEEGAVRACAWPMLLQEAGLARAAGGKLRLTAEGQEALRQEPSHVLKRIWEAWVEGELLDELSRIEAIKGQEGSGARGLSEPADRRLALEEVLEECPVGRWVAVDEFLRYLVASGRDFEVSDSPWNLYVGDREYGSLTDGAWGVLEAPYARCFLMEYAATLGVVDVGFTSARKGWGKGDRRIGSEDMEFLSRYDGLTHVRLNPLGAFLLGVSGTYAPMVAAVRVKVLPTLEVVIASGELAAGDELLLGRFARRTAERVWTIDRERILETMEGGGSIEELDGFLRARGLEDVPAAFATMLHDLAGRAGSVLDRGVGRLIECGDAALAALVASDSRTRRSCALVGETRLFVPSARESAFRRGLRELGYPLSLPR